MIIRKLTYNRITNRVTGSYFGSGDLRSPDDFAGDAYEWLETNDGPVEASVRGSDHVLGVDLPNVNELRFNPLTDLVEAIPRASFETAIGMTLAELETQLAIEYPETPPALIPVLATALKDEHDTYDPLEGYHAWRTDEALILDSIAAKQARGNARRTAFDQSITDASA